VRHHGAGASPQGRLIVNATRADRFDDAIHNREGSKMARSAFARFTAVLPIVAASAVLAQSTPTPAPTPVDPATTMLLHCMRLPAASPQQARCLAEVKRVQAAMQARSAQLAQLRAQMKPAASAPQPAPAAPPAPVPAEVKSAAQATGLAGRQPPQGASLVVPNAGITVGDLSGMDLETAMMTIQSRRAQILEGQLKTQIEAVEARNDSIAKLNSAIAKLNQLVAAYPAGSDANAQVGSVPAYLGSQAEFRNGICGCRPEQEINALLYQTGQQPFTSQNRGPYDSYGRRLDGNGNLTYGPDYGQGAYYWKGGIGGNTSKGQLEMAIASLKGQIDSLSNSQQMDMLKLQSLTNKRNEAFDLMTNFVKKMSDSRSSILGNMR